MSSNSSLNSTAAEEAELNLQYGDIEMSAFEEDRTVIMFPNRRQVWRKRICSRRGLTFCALALVAVAAVMVAAVIASGLHRQLSRLKDERDFLRAQLNESMHMNLVDDDDDCGSGKTDNDVPIRNVIFMLSDGMGPASLALTRALKRYAAHGDDLSAPMPELHLDRHLRGLLRTYSASSTVTDSAAGATAYSCTQKTYNGAIAVDANGTVCGTLMEAARDQRSMRIGLVVTSRVTHATPASFASHVRFRDSEELIAAQLRDAQLDVILGGGRKYFETRSDLRNLTDELVAERGFNVLHNTQELLDATALPIIGLFAKSHMDFELDRSHGAQPSLLDMSAKALDLLSASSPNGFFLLIEGSRIDHASHANDIGAHAHEVLMYDKVFAHVAAFARAHPDTLVVSVSDHETGGLSLGRRYRNFVQYPPYEFRPEQIVQAKSSTARMAAAIEARGRSFEDVMETLRTQAGISSVSDYDREQLSRDEVRQSDDRLIYALGDATAFETFIGWSSIGHSGVDVPLFAINDGAARPLSGVLENTQVGAFIADKLGLDMERATAEAKAKNIDTGARERRRSRMSPHYHG